MKLRNKLKIAKETLEVKFLKKKIPIAVTWAITNTCNLQCRYCGRWKTNSDELSTQEAKIIIEQLAHAGCMRISFLGGEPLLRKDIRTACSCWVHENIFFRRRTFIEKGYWRFN